MFSFQGVSLCPKKPEPKAEAKGNDLKPRGKVSACGSTCDAKQEAERELQESRVPKSDGKHGNRRNGRTDKKAPESPL